MTDSITALATQALELAERATPGEWRVSMTGYSVKSDDEVSPIIAALPGAKMMHEPGAKQFDRWLDNAEFIAFARSALPVLARAYLELVEVSGLGTWANDVRLAAKFAKERDDAARDRDEYKAQHDNALASWATDRRNLEDAAHRSRADLFDVQHERDVLRAQLAKRDAEIRRLQVDVEQLNAAFAAAKKELTP